MESQALCLKALLLHGGEPGDHIELKIQGLKFGDLREIEFERKNTGEGKHTGKSSKYSTSVFPNIHWHTQRVQIQQIAVELL